MKILVFSDSHGYYNRILPIISQHPDADAIIHCGDILNDSLSIQQLLGDKLKVYYVVGNNDYAPNEPKELVLELEGKKIFVTHGHLYGVKNGLDSLRQKVKEGNHLVIYGHTHIPNTEYYLNGTILNPGAMCYTSRSSYAVVTIENGVIKTKIEAI
ncbi:MAG: metallophosphoesterase [Clostridia bacterium]|nr:metallophosphoesterase [Clostridia bacterium]